jgi:hypothetical protein
MFSQIKVRFTLGKQFFLNPIFSLKEKNKICLKEKHCSLGNEVCQNPLPQVLPSSLNGEGKSPSRYTGKFLPVFVVWYLVNLLKEDWGVGKIIWSESLSRHVMNHDFQLPFWLYL